MAWNGKSDYNRWRRALKIVRAGSENDRDLYQKALTYLKWQLGEPIEVSENRALFVDLPDKALVKAPLNSTGETENKTELQSSGGCLRLFKEVNVLLIPYTAWLS